MGAVVPFAGQQVATAFAAATKMMQGDSLSDGIGTSYPVISYKGSKWSLKQGGETKMFLRPDGSPTDTLNVVILRASPTKSKSYFKKYDPDNPTVRPVCWSMNAITPDDDVPEKDKGANACALCPKNKPYKNPEGRRVRDCSDFKRLAVLILPKQSEGLLGKALLEPVFLRIPASSLTNLAKFGDDMGPKGKGFAYFTYVTKITFDPQSEFPKMVFSALDKKDGGGLLTNAEAPLVLELRESPVSYRITGEATDTEVYEVEEAAEELTPGGIGLVEAKAAQQEIIPPEPKQIAAEKVNGLGFSVGEDLEAALDAVEVKSQTKAAPQQTVADTGVVEEADEELLARINGMLKKK